jgi:hypothetical protein
VPTNLYYDAYPTYGVVNSNTGNDATIPLANETNAGLLTPVEKTKISNSALTTYVDSQDALKVDKVAGSRLITSAEVTKLGNTSNTNTGDQNLSAYATTTYVNTQDNLKEPKLGNPDDDGYILSSTTGGTRTWIVPPTGGGGASTFENDIVVALSPNKTLGKYVNGQTILSAGLTFEQVINDIAIEYLFPSITSFSMSGQATTVESGTSLTGNKTFSFSISNAGSTGNAGNVSPDTLSIYQQTVLIGSEFPVSSPVSVAITPVNLTGNGTVYSWYATAVNTQSNIFQSNTYSITSRYKMFYGNVTPTTTNLTGAPTTSSEVRALINNNTFALTQTLSGIVISSTRAFSIAIPTFRNLYSVTSQPSGEILTLNFMANTTVVSVADASGTAFNNYNVYTMVNDSILSVTITITIT